MKSYRRLFEFWKRKNYNTQGDYYKWKRWLIKTPKSFQEAQWKEFDKHMNKKELNSIGTLSIGAGNTHTITQLDCTPEVAVHERAIAIGAEISVLDCNPVPAKSTALRISNGSGYIDLNPVNKEEETETTMRTETQEAKDYLIRSLDQEIHVKDRELVEEFNLRPLWPKSGKELKEFVAKGWVTVNEKLDDDQDFDWGSPTEYLLFRNPEKNEDRDGYNKALKEVQKAASDVKDTIIVHGPEKGLEALNSFKAQTFH